MRPIFFDLETTGISPRTDRIIEIGAYDPLQNKYFQSFVHPGQPIPKESTAINGITDEMVQDAPSIQHVAKDFLDFCSGKVLLIAHNGNSFDFPFFHYELKRAGLSYPDHWHCLDTLLWARKYRKDLPKHSLQYLRGLFSIPENTAHRAVDDTKVLAQLFALMVDDLSIDEIMERGAARPVVDLVKGLLPISSDQQPTLFSL